MPAPTVIGTVSTQEKAELARAAGAEGVILYCDTGFETEVMPITYGAGVNVVYDSVGKTTFDKSIECLQRFGYMVLYGNASGPVTEFNPATLGPKGSLFLTRPYPTTQPTERALKGVVAMSLNGLTKEN